MGLSKEGGFGQEHCAKVTTAVSSSSAAITEGIPTSCNTSCNPTT
jgi:hypothetical protein